ncbi:MAG: sulfatase [Puniceicoccaceae bacterium]
MNFPKARLITLLSIAFLGAFFSANLQASSQPPNVLFIAVDDLRPELGCYGADHMKTPNIDRLASMGTLFKRAYCNVAVCGASRASLMSGIRPTANRFLRHTARQDEQAPDVPSLAEHFRANGYYSISNGKIYHFSADTPESWSEPAWKPDQGHARYLIAENAAIAEQNPKGRGPAFEAAEVPDNAYPDGMVADKAISDLHRLKAMDQPFFLAVGFIRPHLPFNAPKKYWDLYDRNSVRQPDNHFFPLGAPEEARYTFGELRNYSNIPDEVPISDPELRISLRHGYYAATSFADALVGKVVDTLERLGLAENTIIVLWGDHGWQLGEHTYWCKHTNFEVAVQVPLIIVDPRKPKGNKVNALVEYVDIYPTLCELAGLELPGHLQGESMMPLLLDPAAPGKTAVFSRFGRGESIRTDRYRYTAFFDGETIVSDMLYDHLADPHENINIVDIKGSEAIVETLQSTLLSHIEGRQ